MADSNIFKIVIIGRKKTILSLTPQDTQPTIAVDFLSKQVKIDGKTYKLQIWDTAGQERYRKITLTYYRDAQGCLIVYDVTNEKSFTEIDYWIKNVREYTSKPVDFIIVGNKNDLQESKVVQTRQGEVLAEDQNIDFVECSAKTGDNVNLAFEMLLKKMIKRREKKLAAGFKESVCKDKIKLKEEKKKEKCC